MARSLVLLLVVVLGSSGLVLAVAQLKEGSQRATLRAAQEELGHECKQMSSFKRISQMESLIETLKRSLELRDQEKALCANGASLCLASTFKSLTSSNAAALCLSQANALLDLGELLQHKDNVCTSEHMNLIENFHQKYKVDAASTSSPSSSSSSTTTDPTTTSYKKIIKFFDLYSNQVSFLCKSSLLHSLNIVDNHQTEQNDQYIQSLPWLTIAKSTTCKRIEKRETVALESGSNSKDGQQLMATLEAEFSLNEIRSCHASRALSEISSLQELVDAIAKDVEQGFDEKLMQLQLQQQQQQQQQQSQQDQDDQKSGLFLVVPQNQRPIVSRMLDTCARLRPIYDQTVMPLVRLARLGYSPAFANFDQSCLEDRLIQRWFSITLVCNSILSSRLTDVNKYKELEDEVSVDEKSFVVIDEESSGNNNEHSSPETSDSTVTNNDSILEQIEIPIEDELWVHKYTETKLQRLKNSFVKKVFKVFKVEDIDDHIIFRKTVKNTNRWVARLFIVAVAFLALPFKS